MSGIYVLHEMKLASDRLFDAGLHGGLSLDVAAAAVAELIEVGEEFAACDSLDAQKRFKAALSRVRGAE